MIKVAKVLGWVIFGAVGFMLGIKGNPMGWVFVLAAAWLIVAIIRGSADAKDGQFDSTFHIGGCGGDGCGGCGD